MIITLRRASARLLLLEVDGELGRDDDELLLAAAAAAALHAATLGNFPMET